MIGYIYKTTNLKNGKIYIGQHVASKFEPNKYIGSGCLFKAALKYYGNSNFKCELLATCNSINELNELEKYYIKYYNAQDRSIGYNIADGGDEPWNRNKKMTKQYCKTDSIAQRKNAPNISCFDLNTGELVRVFNSCYDAVEFLNIKVSNKIAGSRIHSVCKAKKGHAYGYIWRFETEYLDITKLTDEELLKEHLNPRAKIIEQYDLNNNLIATWESAAAYSKTQTDIYSKQRNIAKTINETCNGKYKTYKGFIWKYKV